MLIKGKLTNEFNNGVVALDSEGNHYFSTKITKIIITVENDIHDYNKNHNDKLKGE